MGNTPKMVQQFYEQRAICGGGGGWDEAISGGGVSAREKSRLRRLGTSSRCRVVVDSGVQWLQEPEPRGTLCVQGRVYFDALHDLRGCMVAVGKVLRLLKSACREEPGRRRKTSKSSCPLSPKTYKLTMASLPYCPEPKTLVGHNMLCHRSTRLRKPCRFPQGFYHTLRLENVNASSHSSRGG